MAVPRGTLRHTSSALPLESPRRAQLASAPTAPAAPTALMEPASLTLQEAADAMLEGLAAQEIADALLADDEPARPPPEAAAAAQPRLRRLALPKSQQGRVAAAAASPQALVEELALYTPMPVPRDEPVMQGLVASPLGHTQRSARQAGPVACGKRRREKEGEDASRRSKAARRAPVDPLPVKVRDAEWADNFWRAGRFCLWMVTKNNGMKREYGGLLGTGLLQREECTEAVRLLDKAVHAAVGLVPAPKHTASAPFCALALALHVCWQREGFVATSEEARRRFSFQGMVATHEEMRKCVDGERIPEPFFDYTAESLRPELDREIGPMRYVGKHSLGRSAKEWKKKLACLDALLKLANEEGLCWGVLHMHGPVRVSHEKQGSRMSRAQQAAASSWGKKKRAVPPPRGP